MKFSFSILLLNFWLFSIAQESINSLRFTDRLDKSSVFAFSVKNNLPLDSPGSMQVIFLNPNEDVNGADFYLKRAASERKSGVILTSVGGGMMAAGAGLTVFGVLKAINEPNFDPQNSPLKDGQYIAAIVNGIVLFSIGLPSMIKGLIGFRDARYFQKKADAKKVGYDFEPAIIQNNRAQNTYGLKFKLSF
jgi:hypothetical protein